jgi:hypothetical protein
MGSFRVGQITLVPNMDESMKEQHVIESSYYVSEAEVKYNSQCEKPVSHS